MRRKRKRAKEREKGRKGSGEVEEAEASVIKCKLPGRLAETASQPSNEHAYVTKREQES